MSIIQIESFTKVSPLSTPVHFCSLSVWLLWESVTLTGVCLDDEKYRFAWHHWGGSNEQHLKDRGLNIFGWQLADFPPGEWGTYGQWASALITGAAFSATFYVIRRDAKYRRHEQANKVIYFERIGISPHNDKIEYVYTVKNMSDHPIYDVSFYYHKATKSGPPLKAPARWVNAGEEAYYQRVGVAEDEQNHPRVAFTDHSGQKWNRTYYGTLKSGGGPGSTFVAPPQVVRQPETTLAPVESQNAE